MNAFLKNILLGLIFFIGAEIAFGQFKTNQVVSSAGAHQTAGKFMVSSTIGEAVVPTFSQGFFVLTQGFQQASSLAGGFLLIQSLARDARCLTSKDGEIISTILNGTPPYTYSWTPDGGNTATATGLGPGIYYLYVTDALDREGRDTITISALVDDACDLHIYHGITPNGDGINDQWHIDGIAIFPDNTVTIYNRWGERVWNATGYNNEDKSWNGQDLNNDKLPDGTYFYVVEIPGVETDKGWVQVTR